MIWIRWVVILVCVIRFFVNIKNGIVMSVNMLILVESFCIVINGFSFSRVKMSIDEINSVKVIGMWMVSRLSKLSRSMMSFIMWFFYLCCEIV